MQAINSRMGTLRVLPADARAHRFAIVHRIYNKHHVRSKNVLRVSSNGVGEGTDVKPHPAETARTLVESCTEGTLCTLSSENLPIGTPASFILDKSGSHVMLSIRSEDVELKNALQNPRCSLHVQPTALPARAVGSVTIMGSFTPSKDPSAEPHTLSVDKCLYYGGLDQVVTEVSGEELRSVESDVLRIGVEDIIKTWNDERAEDIYRIVAHFLKIPLNEMRYAELLWADRLGMYVLAEANAQLQGPQVVRVPFYRAVLDERDARSVITMAAQLAWEEERPYIPPVPSVFTDATAAANN